MVTVNGSPFKKNVCYFNKVNNVNMAGGQKLKVLFFLINIRFIRGLVEVESMCYTDEDDTQSILRLSSNY